MISAQNLQLLLSGSKVKFFFTLLILLSANILIAQDDDDDDEVVTELSKEHPFKHLQSLEKDKKETYHIAFILPIRKKDGSVNKDALSFWEGVQVALPRIKKLNSKFKIHIWDNYNSDSITKSIIQNDLMNLPIDVVVAPFYTKEAFIVSQFCKNNRIPMFLPLNPSDAVAKNNPYVFKLSTSKNRMFFDIYKEIVSSPEEKNTKLFYLYDSSSKNERRMAHYLNYAQKKDGSNRLTIIPSSQSSEIIPKMSSTNTNVLLVSQYKDVQVNEILNALKEEDKVIKIYGNASWVRNPRILLENVSSFNTMVHSEFYLRKNAPEFEEVKKQYYELCSDNVNSEVFQGYDLINYITQVIEMYGKKFPLNVEKYSYKGLSTNIEMKPLYDDEDRILFYENVYKDILKAYPEGWYRIND
jgi:ABC-type branched-subunit amino acid transport system substrate-binding protein